MTKIIINEAQAKVLIENIISEQKVVNSIRIYEYPNDRRWAYSVQNGSWYASRKDVPSSQSRWIKISDDPRYVSSVEKLDKQFPNARPEVQVAGIPTRNVPPTPKYDFDPEINGYELPTPGYKDPNRFINKIKAKNNI